MFNTMPAGYPNPMAGVIGDPNYLEQARKQQEFARRALQQQGAATPAQQPVQGPGPASELTGLLHRLEGVGMHARANRDRLDALVCRAYGPTPTDQINASEAAPYPTGAASALRSLIDAIDQINQATTAHIERLETFV